MTRKRLTGLHVQPLYHVSKSIASDFGPLGGAIASCAFVKLVLDGEIFFVVSELWEMRKVGSAETGTGRKQVNLGSIESALIRKRS